MNFAVKSAIKGVQLAAKGLKFLAIDVPATVVGILDNYKVIDTAIQLTQNPIEVLSSPWKNQHTKLYDAIAVLKETMDTYQEDLGINPGGVYDNASKGAFIRLANQSAKDVTFFKDITDSKGDIGKRLDAKPVGATAPTAAETASAQVRTTVEEALKKEKAFNDAKTNYTLDVEAFEKACLSIPLKGSAQGLALEMQAKMRVAEDAIKNQQKLELERLNTLLFGPLDPDPTKGRTPNAATNTFTANLQTSLGSTPAEVETVKKQMVTTLQTSHQKQLGEFTTQTKKAETNLFDAVTKQAERDTFLHIVYANSDEEMQKEFDRAMEVKRARLASQGIDVPAAGIVYTGGKKGTINRTINFSNIDINDLNFIKTITGKKITQDPNKPGVWTLKSVNMWRDPLYYGSLKKNPMTDMLVMANAVKYSGAQTITMTMNYKSKRVEEIRAKEAYEACIKAGFPPEKIYIKLSSGKIYTNAPAPADKEKAKNYSGIENLFGEIGATKLNEIHVEAQKIADQKAKAPKFDATMPLQMKDNLAKVRSDAATVLAAARTKAGPEADQMKKAEADYKGPAPT